MQTVERQRKRRKVYTEPPKAWNQKDHPSLPWVASLLALLLLALTVWFLVPVLKQNRHTDAELQRIAGF
jgi:hypothetical protein